MYVIYTYVGNLNPWEFWYWSIYSKLFHTIKSIIWIRQIIHLNNSELFQIFTSKREQNKVLLCSVIHLFNRIYSIANTHNIYLHSVRKHIVSVECQFVWSIKIFFLTGSFCIRIFVHVPISGLAEAFAWTRIISNFSLPYVRGSANDIQYFLMIFKIPVVIPPKTWNSCRFLD